MTCTSPIIVTLTHAGGPLTELPAWARREALAGACYVRHRDQAAAPPSRAAPTVSRRARPATRRIRSL